MFHTLLYVHGSASLYLKMLCLCDWQNGLDTKIEKSRKQIKERKNRAKKIRGVKKVRLLVTKCLLSCFYLFFFFLLCLNPCESCLFNVCRQRLVIPRRSEILKRESLSCGFLFSIINHLLCYLSAVRSFLQLDMFTEISDFRLFCSSRFMF